MNTVPNVDKNTRIYLTVVGLLYVALGIWCAALPETTSRSVGFTLIPGSGQSEFLAVYGGLEIGLGAFFLMASRDPRRLAASRDASIAVHAGIVFFRALSFFLYSGIGTTTKALAPVEWLILGVGLWTAKTARAAKS